MDDLTIAELEEAIRAITSTLRKSEKVQLKLKAGTFQHKTIIREIKAYNIAIVLIQRESGKNIAEDSFEGKYTKEELEEALKALTSATGRVEKVQPKFETGTSQHTLAVRRIKAFNISIVLLKRELDMYRRTINVS